MASETNSEVGQSTGDAAGGVFPPFDSSTYGSQLLWLAITFGILYYVISKVIIPRIGSIVEVRANRIEQDIAEAQRLKEQSDDAIASYEKALADARNKAQGIAQGARDKAKAETDEAVMKVEADLAEKLSDAEQKISDIREKAMAEVDGIAGETTEEVVKTLIGGRVTKTEVKNALANVAG